MVCKQISTKSGMRAGLVGAGWSGAACACTMQNSPAQNNTGYIVDAQGYCIHSSGMQLIRRIQSTPCSSLTKGHS